MSDQPPPPGSGQPGPSPYGGPPFGESATPPPGQPAYGQPPPTAYPQQQLSHQQVEPRRSRVPLYIAAGVVLLLLVAAVGGWIVLRDGGEEGRAEYCAALDDLTQGGDPMSALGSVDGSTLGRIDDLAALAPDAVADDWTTVTDLLDSAGASQTPSPVMLVRAFGASKAIVEDANSECGMSLETPGF